MTIKRGSGGAQEGFARILANTGWLLGGKGVGAVLSLAYLAIVTRTLGVADFGRFALVLSATGLIQTLVNFDSWQIVVRYGQPHLASGNGDALNRVLRFCILIDLGSAVAGGLIAAFIILAFGPLMQLSAGMGWQAWIFCMVMMITIRSSPTGVLRLFDRFDTGAFAETMIPVGRMIGAALAWMLMPNVTGFLIAWGAAELLCAISYWWLALRVGGDRLGSWRAGRALDARRENPGIVGFLTATNLQTTLSSVGQQVAVLVVGLFAGPAGAGLYRLANQLANSLTKISGLLSRSIFVELSRTHSSHGHEALGTLFRRTNRLALVAGAVIIALILAVGHPLLGLIAGKAFLPAYPLLLLLGIAACIDLVGVSYRPLLMATDRASLSLRITLVSTVLLLGMQAALLPIYGTVGAASANIVASIAGFAMMGLASRRVLTRSDMKEAG
ncbi:polysaccharide biosynthesis protein [Sphingobium indicum IP26]|uniref:Polysaccharide biosynthesis protein n=1 Tax=Sphingobium indicum F2 TaxID=1450518 RepID=A0A8E0WPK7_9SPHN|nr:MULTISPECIES: oligosaccharide flippase family protein [Sphingobium]EPR18308.1 polysaccharide biosynthesis protein [Sphingobium indicum IP26]EQB06811.1 polysaccharide biosynthesis protein [Sphingobium sp. HDIP04]KER34981.1 polysaccharide biosynthesis protein [Sphingobium indicum F2]